MLRNLCANTTQCSVGASSVVAFPGIMTKSARFNSVFTANVLVRRPYLHCKTDNKMYIPSISTNSCSMIRVWWLHNYFPNYLWRYYVIVFPELHTKSFHIFCIERPFLFNQIHQGLKKLAFIICFCALLWNLCRIAKTRLWNWSSDPEINRGWGNIPFGRIRAWNGAEYDMQKCPVYAANFFSELGETAPVRLWSWCVDFKLTFEWGPCAMCILL